jgi:hypothetical protein
MFKKILFGLLALCTIGLSQTPDQTRVAYFDTVKIDSSGQFVDITGWLDASPNINVSDSLGAYWDSSEVIANNYPDYVWYDTLILTDHATWDTMLYWYNGLLNTVGNNCVRYTGTYDRTYYVGMSYDTFAGESYTSYVWYYDHSADTVSSPVKLPSNASRADNHIMGTLVVSDSGYILVFTDSIYDAGHNKGIQMFKSSASEDITTMTDMGRISATSESYPAAYKTANGYIHVFTRYGLGASDHYRTGYHLSTDGGNTWTSSILSSLGTGAGNYWAYARQATTLDPDSNIVYRIIQGFNNDTGKNKWVYFYWTRDGNTWYDITGTHSHDLGVSGTISASDMNTYFLIDSVGASPARCIAYAAGNISDNFFVMVDTTDGTNPFYLTMFYNSGGSLLSKAGPSLDRNLSSDVMVSSAWMAKTVKNHTLILCYNDSTNGTTDVFQYRTLNKGNTWTKTSAWIETGAGDGARLSGFPIIPNAFDEKTEDIFIHYMYGTAGTGSTDPRTMIIKKYTLFYRER